ncbi:MAG TPA: choline/ethanolamine kinase family protein [Gammaproteobacteria bacterium]
MNRELIARIGGDEFGALCECLGVDADGLQARPLSGGLYSRSVLIRSPNGEWVVRFPSEGVAGRLDPGEETSLLAELSAWGLSPPPHPAAPDGFVVTRYLAGARTLTEAEVGDVANMKRIVGVLRKLHTVAFDLPEFRAVPVARSYVDRLDTDALNPEQAAWAEECLLLAEDFDGHGGPLALCHNDLVASNLLDDGGLWLIDFEYAVLADPILDLASLAAMNGFDDSQCDVLTGLYFRNEPPPFDRTAFFDAVRLLRLVAYLWALGNRATGSEDTASGAFVARVAAMLR